MVEVCGDGGGVAESEGVEGVVVGYGAVAWQEGVVAIG